MLSDVIPDQDLIGPPILRAKSSKTSSASIPNYQAYLYASLASFFIVGTQLSLKSLTKHFSPTLMLGMRCSILFICSTLYMQMNGMKVHVQNQTTFKALVKRTLASSVTFVMYLGSVKYLPMGIVNALFNTTPIMTFFIEAIYYKKTKTNLLNLIIIIISFVGVLLIIQPPFLFGKTSETEQNYIFYFVVLFSALTGSFSILFLHDLRGKCSQILVLEHNYFGQTMVSLLVFMFTNSPEAQSQQLEYFYSMSLEQALINLGYLLLLVVSAFLNQYLQAKAIFLCTPALIMPFGYLSVVFGMIIDVAVFGSTYNGMMIVGVIMASVGLFTKFVALYVSPPKPFTK